MQKKGRVQGRLPAPQKCLRLKFFQALKEATVSRRLKQTASITWGSWKHIVKKSSKSKQNKEREREREKKEVGR